MKILIVDDEPLVRKSLGRAFKSKGHEVIEAVDGNDGLARWIETSPDLVFVDVLMPGLSGPELLAEIGRRFGTVGPGESKGGDEPEASDGGEDRVVGRKKNARVILMSAYSGEHNVATAQQMGADLFVPKPFDDVFALVAKAEELFVGSERQR